MRAWPSFARLIRLALGLLGAAALVVIFAVPRALGMRWAAMAPVRVHRALAFALGLRVEAVGAPARGALLAANHVSWLDIVALGALAPVTFVAKSELGPNAAMRALLALQGIVFVVRARRTSIPDANAGIANALARGESVVLFAEATTGDGNRVLPFRSSHFEAARATEALVQPVFITYSRRAGLLVTRADRPTIAWYGSMTFAPHFWAVLREGRLTCRVTFADGVDGESRKALARAAQKTMRGRRAGP